MKTKEKLTKIGVEVPKLEKTNGNIEEAIKIVKEFNSDLKKEYEKIIEYFIEKYDLDGKIIEDFKKDLKYSGFVNEKDLTNNKDWEKLEKKFWELTKHQFNMELEIATSEYYEKEIEFCFKSELYRFFHEDPGKKRERFEKSRRKKINKLEEKINKIEAKQEKLENIELSCDEQKIFESFANLFDKLHNVVI